MYRVILKYAAVAAVSAFIVSPAHAVEVYLFKGAGDFSFVNDNLHFSRGLTKIADTLNAEGIHAEVRRFGAVEDALATIRQRKPKTVALIGHSMGALASMGMARSLRGEGIEIVYMGLIDIPGPVGVAGDNVAWVENYYSINPVYGKLTNVNSHPKARNIHVSGYIHNRMDDSPQVQNGMLGAIRQIHAAELELELQQEPEGLLVDASPLETFGNQPQAVQQIAETPLPNETEIEGFLATQPSAYSSGSVSAGTNLNDAQAQIVQPHVLPSVDVGTNPYDLPQSGDPLLYQNAQSQQFESPQPIDPVTTSSVQKPGLLDRGRSLLRRAGSFVRTLNENRNVRANSFAPDPER
ncbi:MAG: thioesterase domain-containing protein [Pseudomonadota bacterium]